MKVVAVKFRTVGSEVYSADRSYYKTTEDLIPGDLVVLRSETGYYNIAMVDSINLTLDHKISGYIIQKVDTDRYSELLEKDSELSTIKEAMDKRVKSIQENRMYEMLAKEDEVLAELLIEYKSKLAEL